MIKIIHSVAFLTLAMSSFVSATLSAEEIHRDAPVDTATLYPNQAILARQLQVNLAKPGRHQIIVSPALTDQVDAINAAIDGADLHGISLEPIADNALSHIQSALVENEIAQLANNQAIEVAEQMMISLAKRLSDSDSVSVTEVQEKLDQLQEKYRALLDTKLQLEREKEKWVEQQQWQEQDNAMRYTIVFDVEAKSAGEVSLHWQTTTKQARWQPSSEWRLNSQSAYLSIDALAQVTQKTGMDWSDVELILAITPPRYVEQPFLQAQTVSVIEPPQQGALNPMLGMMRSASEESLAPDELNSQPVIVNSGVDFQVRLPGKYLLESNETGQHFPYWHGEVNLEVYSAVYDWAWPGETALLVAQWQMPNEVHVLPGKMTLYRDGTFITRIPDMDWYRAGSEQTLSFGEDPQLLVKIDHPPQYNQSQGVINKANKLTQRTKISLTNQADTEKDVRVYSRLPVATHSSISIDPVWLPQPSKQNAQGIKGLTLWKRSLPSHETWQIQTGYELRYPEDKQLIGIE